MDNINLWIQETNREILEISTDKIEYNRFIQLYFIFNNILKKSNSLNPNLNFRTDTSIVTEYLPNVFDSKWSDIKILEGVEIKNNLKLLAKLMQFYIQNALQHNFFADSGLKKSKNILFTEVKEIGFFDETTSFRFKSITVSDFDSFSNISKYNKFAKVKTNLLLKGVLKTIYAVRNNFYHGGKSEIEGQENLLFFLNYSMLLLIKIVAIINKSIISSTTNALDEYFEFNNIESRYKAELKNKIKKRLKGYNIKESSDLDNWLNVVNNQSTFLKFAYFYIVFERLNKVIQKVILETETDIIASIRSLQLYLSENFPELAEVETNYTQYKSIRDNIFHGNGDLLNKTNLDIYNEKLKNSISKIRIWIESVAN